MMCPLVWMVGLLLMVPGFRTAAEALKDTSSKERELQCYSCGEYEDESALIPCRDGLGVIVVTCPVERPVCLSVANVTEYSFFIGCGPATGKSKSFSYEIDPVLKSDLTVTFQCSEPKCNRPIDRAFIDLLKSKFNNNQSASIARIFENFTSIENASMDEVLVKTSDMHFAEIKHRSKRPTPVPTPGTSKSVNSTIGIPKAEPLKLDPLASDDDEDDGEGSGSSEDFKNNRLSSSPSDPSSYLPAKENRANYYYKARNIIAVAVSIIILICADM